MKDDKNQTHTDGSANEERVAWEGIEDLPIFDREVLELLDSRSKRLDLMSTVLDVYRFVHINCDFTQEKIGQIGESILANVPRWSKCSLNRFLAQIYLLGILDGCRMFREQIDRDAVRVRNGQILWPLNSAA